MRVLTSTYATNEYDGCTYAYLDITPELAQLIAKRAEAYRRINAEDRSIACLEFFDSSAVFLNDIPEDLETPVDEGQEWADWAETGASEEEITTFAARTECDRMVVTDKEVYWTAIPKHTDARVETRPIPMDVVQSVLHSVGAPV